MSEKATLPTTNPAIEPRILKAEDFPENRRDSSASKRPVLRLLAFTSLALIMLVSFGKHLVPASAGVTRSMMRGCGKGRMLSSSAGLPTHYSLPSGDKIPSVALGVWQAPPEQVGAAVEAALAAGYRHIDGAWIYRNEEAVGAALQKSGLPRDKVWLTSKLWNSFHAPENVEKALDESLKKLGVDYLDLYLIHWPVAFKGEEKTKEGKPVVDEALTADPYPTWQALEKLVEKGKVRNIGVSNFNIPRLKNLTANPLKIQPAVNQVELNVFNPQPELLAFAKKHNLLLEAYSPLGSTQQVGKALSLPAVKKVAKALDITPAQAIISWHVQRGTVVLPKSVTPSRVVENLQVRKLPKDLFEGLEKEVASHRAQRVVNPSKGWGLDYDIFDDYPYKN